MHVLPLDPFIVNHTVIIFRNTIPHSIQSTSTLYDEKTEKKKI